MTVACHVLRTNPQREESARAWVDKEGFETFLPIGVERIVRKSRVQHRRCIMFPSYLFVWFDAVNAAWRRLGSLPNVSHVMCNFEKPVQVPDKVINEIKARRRGQNGFIPLYDADDEGEVAFKEGDKLEIISGPLTGMPCFFSSIEGERIKALLSIFGRQSPCELYLDQVITAA